MVSAQDSAHLIGESASLVCVQLKKRDFEKKSLTKMMEILNLREKQFQRDVHCAKNISMTFQVTITLQLFEIHGQKCQQQWGSFFRSDLIINFVKFDTTFCQFWLIMSNSPANLTICGKTPWLSFSVKSYQVCFSEKSPILIYTV